MPSAAIFLSFAGHFEFKLCFRRAGRREHCRRETCARDAKLWKTMFEMVSFKTCASWLWKMAKSGENGTADDDRRWQIGVRARGARTTGRASSYEEPREAVLAVQLTRQLKLKLMKWSGEHAYHGDDAPRRSEWRQVGREETRSVCRVEERQKVRPAQWTRAVCVCMAITERYYRPTLRNGHSDALSEKTLTIDDGAN